MATKDSKKASASSSVRLSFPSRIWALVFEALARLVAGLPVTGLGHREFSVGPDRWVASISSEHKSVHVYCERQGEVKLQLNRRINDLRALIPTFSARIRAVEQVLGDADGAAATKYEKELKAIRAEEAAARKDLKAALTQLGEIPGSVDMTIDIAALQTLEGFEIDVPAEAVMGYEEREEARNAAIGYVPGEVEPEKEKEPFSLANAGPFSARLADIVGSVARKPSPEALVDMEWGELQAVAKSLDVSANLKKDEMVAAILESDKVLDVLVPLTPADLQSVYDEVAMHGDVPLPGSVQPREDAVWLGGCWAYRDEGAQPLTEGA